MSYPDPELRLALSRAVAIESARGWRITKDKQTHKIDIVIALAMSSLSAIQTQSKFRYDSSLQWVSRSGSEADAAAEAHEFLQRRLTQHILVHGGFYRQLWR